MMINKRYFQVLAIQIASMVLILSLLQACAGGGETGTGQNDTTVSVGVITGFGSVYVNGVKFETNSNTAVSVDGVANSPESSLAVGMLVTVSGSVNADGATGAANSIVFEDNVEGLVIENALAIGGLFNVMGQNIIVDNETVFKTNDPSITIIEEIQKDHIVEVSGFSNGDGNIYATRIELKSTSYNSGDEIEVKGIVTAVSASNLTIGNMTVSYSAGVLDGFTSGVQLDDYVSVKSTQGFVGSDLVASKIELKERTSIASTLEVNHEIEFEGIVSLFNLTERTFELNGEKIILNNDTKYGDDTISDLANKKKVKIHGVVDINGAIVATEVDIKTASSTYYEGNVTEINLTESFIKLLGVTVYINSSTRLVDDLSSDNTSPDYDKQYFNLTDLNLNDNVEVSVFADSTGKLIASKLERENAEEQITDPDHGTGLERELEGVVSGYSVNSTTIIVSGVTINIETAVSKGMVSGVLDNGVTVEINGIETTTGWFATEIDVKDSTVSKSEPEGD